MSCSPPGLFIPTASTSSGAPSRETSETINPYDTILNLADLPNVGHEVPPPTLSPVSGWPFGHTTEASIAIQDAPLPATETIPTPTATPSSHQDLCATLTNGIQIMTHKFMVSPLERLRPILDEQGFTTWTNLILRTRSGNPEDSTLRERLRFRRQEWNRNPFLTEEEESILQHMSVFIDVRRGQLPGEFLEYLRFINMILEFHIEQEGTQYDIANNRQRGFFSSQHGTGADVPWYTEVAPPSYVAPRPSSTCKYFRIKSFLNDDILIH